MSSRQILIVNTGNVFVREIDVNVWDELLFHSLNFPKIMKQVLSEWRLLSDVHLCLCHSSSIPPHFSLHLSMLLSLLHSSLSVFASLSLPVAVGSFTLASHRLPLASRLTDWSSHCLSDATVTAPFWALCSSELADSISSLSSRYIFDISYCFHWNRTSLLLLFKTNALARASLWGVRRSLWNGTGSEPKWAEATGKIWEKQTSFNSFQATLSVCGTMFQLQMPSQGWSFI